MKWINFIWQNVFVCTTDDECFYVGLGHKGQSSRKGNNYVPNDYRPFQCCPKKVERSTRVPKMSAQKIGHKKDNDDDRTHFDFTSSSSKKDSSSAGNKNTPKYKTSTTSSHKPSSSSAKKPAKKSNRDDDDDDDDHVTPSHTEKKEPKKSSSASKGNKETVKAKPGQKGLLGIAKIVNWF